MAWPGSSPYFIGDATFAYNDSPGTAQKVQVSLSGNFSGFGHLGPLTVQPELFTLLPRQCSYPSGHLRANGGIDDPTGRFFPFARGDLVTNRSLYNGISCLETIDRIEVGDELVPQKHVDVLSDGVYLNTASRESFMGVSLSPSVGPTTFTRSRLSVQLDGPPSQSDIYSTPRSLLQKYSSTSTLHESNIPDHIPQPPDQPSNAEKGAYQHARQHRPRSAKALPATLLGPACSTDVFDGVSSPEPATRRSSRTSVRTYSSLRKDRSRSPEHDFAVVIVERESSGESTDCSESRNHKVASIQSSEHSVAAKAANIIRDWKIESNIEEQQRMEWEAYGKSELETGLACHRIVWRKDLFLRDCQLQIQTKLRNGHVFILQKLPPAAFTTKIVTCAHPYCPAPQKRSPPASYRLSLEPKENLKRAVVPTEPLHIVHVSERCVGKVKDGMLGEGEAGVTWYCLTCVEDLWRGAGMLQGKPQVKRERRKGNHVNFEHLGSSGERTSVDTTHHPDLSGPRPLRKKAKLYIRGPRTPTEAARVMTQSGDVEEYHLELVTMQGSGKAFDSPSLARSSSSTLSNDEKTTNMGQFETNSNAQKPSSIRAKQMSRRPPLSLDGTITDMPPPPARSREGVGQATIQPAAMEVGAMLATEEEAEEGASFEIPRRQRTASSYSMRQSVPFVGIHLADGPTSLSSTAMENGSKGIALTITTMTRSAQPTITPIPTPKTSEWPLHSLGTDSGYITEISGDESPHSRLLDKPPKTFSQVLQHPLGREREIELTVGDLDSKRAKGAMSKKRKVLDDTIMDPIKPATISRHQSAAESRVRPPARDGKGQLRTRVDAGNSDGPRPPTSKVTRTRSKKKRVVVNANLPALSKERGHLPVAVPEHWCICQQLGDEHDMLQCDGEYCLIGWFHLRCTDLAVMPEQHEPWYCRACHLLYPPPFDGPPDSDSPSLSHPRPQIKTPLKRPRTHSSSPSHAHLLPPPSTTSQPALASIAHFIHAETRPHPSGHYALSSPQLFALRRWKAVICYQQMFEVTGNRGFMERNGLDYRYPDQEDEEGEGGEVIVDGLGGWEDGGGDRRWGTGGNGKGGAEAEWDGQGETSMGIMEIGGLVVEVTKKEVRGRELSQVLRVVDGRVEAELVRLGWCDDGVEREKGGERGKVRLKLRVGERTGDEQSESESSERELDKGKESGKVRLKLRVGRKDVGGSEGE